MTVEMLPMEEAVKALDCGEEKVVELLKGGKLPGLKIGRSWVIPRAAFFDAVNALAVAESAKRLQRIHGAPGPAPILVGQKKKPGRPRLDPFAQH